MASLASVGIVHNTIKSYSVFNCKMSEDNQVQSKMLSLIKVETIATIIFYLVLAVVLAFSFQNVLNSQTAYEENQLEGDIKLPSITICPNRIENSNDKIEDFDMALASIKKAKELYSAQMDWAKDYHET